MKTWPLTSISLEEATQKQFKLVDSITKYFNGSDILTRGDLGVVPGLNRPRTTQKVEHVLADFFGAEDALLVRGAGTTALRYAIYSAIKPNHTLLVHDAPIYPTTQVTLNMFNIKVIKADFNNVKNLNSVLEENKVDGALVQLTRQQPSDSYDAKEVIQILNKALPNLPVITDDNYAVMKIPEIGVEMGSSLSTFSLFKLLGPEGIGCLVGSTKYIDSLREDSYSGGLQVQGHEAIDVLRGLAYAPVALAISAQTSQEVCDRLNAGEVDGVKEAFIANAQSKVILIEFNENIAKHVLTKAEKLGAAPHPVGAESKYELTPMFYRVSNTFMQYDSTLPDRMIRVNPMRSGPETVLRILKEALEQVKSNSRNEKYSE
ncbi:PLP-dependent transferase [Alkalibacterium iburiense]|uniref:PLP-dependent transferase n=1 Tax=Alkalibacterium iburiense TaxID=290589 RepID=A0ABN0X7K2_9LACT